MPRNKKVKSFLALADATVTLFHRLKAAAAELHEDGDPAAPRRGVMRSLHAHGPATVPELAAMRPVSRQHIQQVVNGLLGDRLVAYRPNPRHKKSKLVALTKKGEKHLKEIADREEAVIKDLFLGLSDREMAEAARCLKTAAAALESDQWHTLAEKIKKGGD